MATKKILTLERLQEYNGLIKQYVDNRSTELRSYIGEVPSSYQTVIAYVQGYVNSTNADLINSYIGELPGNHQTVIAYIQSVLSYATNGDTNIRNYVGEIPAASPASTVIEYIGIGDENVRSYVGEIPATSDATTVVDYINAKTEGIATDAALGELQGQVTTLIGNDANKSVRTIANEELAAQLIAEDAQTSLDTLTEIAAWIQSHPEDAAAMNKAIDDLEALVGTLPAGITATTVTGYVTEVKNAVEAEIDSVVEDIDDLQLVDEEIIERLTFVEDSLGLGDSVAPTAVPTSGYVDKVYVNTNLSTEEVCNTIDSCCSSSDNGEWIFAVDDSNYLHISNYRGMHRIYLDKEGVRYEIFNSSGWQNNFTNPIVVNSEILNPEDESTSSLFFSDYLGRYNDQLANLFSITPFESSMNVYTKDEVDVLIEEVNSALNNKATVSSVNAVAADLDKAEVEIARLDAEKQDVITESGSIKKDVTVPSENLFPGATIVSDAIQPSDVSMLFVDGSYNGVSFSASLSDFTNTGTSLMYTSSDGFSVVDLQFQEDGVVIFFDEVGAPVTFVRIIYSASGGTVVKKEHLPTDLVYISGLATVATSGSYSDLSNKPTIPTKASWNYDDVYVKYSAAQTLNDTQKAQARTNIGASNFTGYTSSNKLSTSYISGLATVATSGSYSDLSNKPTIPTVNNGVLTIQQNGENLITFAANQSTNVSANITVPTKVSDLTNDSGFTTNKGTVIGSSLTDGFFVMGNGGVNVDISTMKPTTSTTTWSTTSDVYVPTMKAISNYISSEFEEITSAEIQALFTA